MYYFGENWGAPVCQTTEQKPTPVGQVCYHCGEAIEEGNRGFLMPVVTLPEQEVAEPPFQIIHLECLIRTTVGSLGHLHKKCSCYGGNEDDPPGMTKRQAAIAAFEEFSRQPNYSGLKDAGPPLEE